MIYRTSRPGTKASAVTAASGGNSGDAGRDSIIARTGKAEKLSEQPAIGPQNVYAALEDDEDAGKSPG